MESAVLFLSVCLMAVVVSIGAQDVPQSAQLSAAVNSFSVDVFSLLSLSEGQKNVFLSPFSISTVLTMLLTGARNTTADQLTRALHLDAIDGPNTGIQLVSEAIKRKADDPSLAIANQILVAKEESGTENTILSAFKSQIADLFDASVQDVDFGKDGEKIKNQVNDWVQEKTHGLIGSLLSESPSPATVLLLLNAIYFKGQWDKQFDPRATRNGTFLNQGSNGSETEFMRRSLTVRYSHTTDQDNITSKAIEIPYQNDTYSMIILLPDESDGLNKILSSPNAKTTLTAAIASLTDDTKRTVSVRIPKFKVETEYDMIPILQAAGITEVFGAEADLSGIKGSKSLQVSGVKHKAVVQVDEEGTKAAAVTGVFVTATSAAPPPLLFNADHPFLFLIKDRVTGMILFIGKIEEL